PLLLRLALVIRHAYVDAARGPILRCFPDILRRNRRARAAEHSAAVASRGWRPARTCWTAATTASAAPAADRHFFHREFERRARAHRLDLVRARSQILTRDRPAILPLQRTNIERTRAAAIQIGLKVHREFLHALPEIEQSEMPGTNHA